MLNPEDINLPLNSELILEAPKRAVYSDDYVAESYDFFLSVEEDFLEKYDYPVLSCCNRNKVSPWIRGEGGKEELEWPCKEIFLPDNYLKPVLGNKGVYSSSCKNLLMFLSYDDENFIIGKINPRRLSKDVLSFCNDPENYKGSFIVNFWEDFIDSPYLFNEERYPLPSYVLRKRHYQL